MNKKIPKALYNENKSPFGELSTNTQREMKRHKEIDVYMKDSISGFHWEQISYGSCQFYPELVYRVRPQSSVYEHNVTKKLLDMTQAEIEKCVILTRKLSKLFKGDELANQGTVSERLEYMTEQLVKKANRLDKLSDCLDGREKMLNHLLKTKKNGN